MPPRTSPPSSDTISRGVPDESGQCVPQRPFDFRAAEKQPGRAARVDLNWQGNPGQGSQEAWQTATMDNEGQRESINELLGDGGDGRGDGQNTATVT